MTYPQVLLSGDAEGGATNAHTGLHQAIHELRHGSVAEAKQLVARQIAPKSECEACCCSYADSGIYVMRSLNAVVNLYIFDTAFGYAPGAVDIVPTYQCS
ncbi:hypothetical protein [aff. Roholtiella sp. LEGE 12411]|uniref:hypothetical protein n=1 Tax=aff. Roholtiella sp. LEGE 12411 TaxID=1828822 RepID=UPI00187FD0AC|nr:hypothetical protein [aff. Roholtiella sp. LEGE 12411]MBE9038767.1 hypothetical protein [aff. Roholtiella sp. LEGE 12411]